mmetsp:Transcript_18338/g.42929  ORF Transcript_18338/g.42929 Transcript_18338/m.42929 type:complete len:213 (+) Transcript_18338:2222-2860(+)
MRCHVRYQQRGNERSHQTIDQEKGPRCDATFGARPTAMSPNQVKLPVREMKCTQDNHTGLQRNDDSNDHGHRPLHRRHLPQPLPILLHMIMGCHPHCGCWNRLITVLMLLRGEGVEHRLGEHGALFLRLALRSHSLVHVQQLPLNEDCATIVDVCLRSGLALHPLRLCSKHFADGGMRDVLAICRLSLPRSESTRMSTSQLGGLRLHHFLLE